MANTIGTAYVQVEPSFDGVVSKIDKEFGGAGASSGKTFSSGFASVVGSAAGTVGSAIAGLGKLAMGATAAGTAAVGTLAKSAVSAYADFEQLEGGAKLLFGDAFTTVMNNANSAFSRVQMSANDYLAQANSYATGLKESLGGDTKAAADLADGIMVAQADIVAATGQSQEAVQNAFNGIMKNNFMMLDNLAIGINPTKEGMQEVIDKMNEWNKTQGKVTNYQMGNLADMESALVDYVSYVEMAGYAQNEASETIQGSVASMKAAWENLLTGIGSGADLSGLIDNLVNSVTTVFHNIKPIIENALKGISQLITQLAPEIASALPSLITEVLPGFIDAGIQLIGALAEGIMSNIDQLVMAAFDIIELFMNSLLDATSGEGGNAIMEIINWIAGAFEENYMTLLDVGVQILANIGKGIMEGLPELLGYIQEIIMYLVNLIIENLPTIIQGIVELLVMIGERLASLFPVLIPALVQGLITLAQALIDNLPILLNAIIQVCQGITQGVINALPLLIDKIPSLLAQIVMAIIENAPVLLQAVFDIMGQMALALLDAGQQLFTNIAQLFQQILAYLNNLLPQLPSIIAYHAGQMVGKFLTAVTSLPDKLKAIWDNIVAKVTEFGKTFMNKGTETANKFKEFFTTPLNEMPQKMMQIGKNIVDGLLNGIKNAWGNLTGAVGEMASSFIEGVKSQFKIGSPSKVMEEEIGRWIPPGIAVGIEDSMGVLDTAVDDMTADVVSRAQIEDMSSQNANVTYSVTENDSQVSVVGLLTSYLPAILQAAQDGNVVLSPDTQAIFNVVKNENKIYKRMNGASAFA